jgi:hypothetical protein
MFDGFCAQDCHRSLKIASTLTIYLNRLFPIFFSRGAHWLVRSNRCVRTRNACSPGLTVFSVVKSTAQFRRGSASAVGSGFCLGRELYHQLREIDSSGFRPVGYFFLQPLSTAHIQGQRIGSSVAICPENRRNLG